MRKILLTSLSVVAIMGFMMAKGAQAGVAGTDHDLTAKVATGTAGVCVFCHTPHNGSAAAPLWNRNGPATATFTTYTSPSLDAGTAGVAPQPSGVSAACLSCHDGATAWDDVINNTGFTAPGNMGAGATPGTDLSTTHPVSIEYGLGPSGDFVAAASVVGVKLYGTTTKTVECASCHDPHNSALPKFQRIDNAASQMCIACHNK